MGEYMITAEQYFRSRTDADLIADKENYRRLIEKERQIATTADKSGSTWWMVKHWKKGLEMAEAEIKKRQKAKEPIQLTIT